MNDVLIVGGGPAGTAAAMFLIREGIKPIIVEAEDFPRYHVGESMTGAGGQVLRELDLEAKMYQHKYPTKQGVKVFGRSTRGTWFVPVMGRDEHRNLFEWETWQVRRSDFDKMMLDEAVSRGANLLPGKAIKPLVEDGSVCGAQVRMSDGGVQDIRSQVLLDCSGIATWLANQGGITGPKYLGTYDKQIAIFSQVAGSIRDDSDTREDHKDNTLIFYKEKYHWAWFIPLDDEVVSIGIVVPAAYFLDKRESKRDFFLREIQELHPELKRRNLEPKLVEGMHAIPNYSYQVKAFTGKGFMCIGDSHRFIDPIFSFGLTVALREAQLAAPVIRSYLEGEKRDDNNPFAEFELLCEKGIDILEDVTDAFWEHPLQFALYVYLRHPEDMIDMFAGRIYQHENQPSTAIQAFRKLLGREGERERSYESEDLYSVPIGSRYHPERARIWENDSPIGNTESWVDSR